MNPVQRQAFNSEMSEALALIEAVDVDGGFTHLARAHVLGQAYVVPHAHAHAQTHWRMLRVEVKRGRPLAVIGQAVLTLNDFASKIHWILRGRLMPTKGVLCASCDIACALTAHVDQGRVVKIS